MLTEQNKVLARIRPGSERAGLLLLALVAVALVGSAIIGVVTSPETVLVPILGLPAALVFYYVWFKQPIHIFLLLQRNARRPGRPLAWSAGGYLTILDSRLFSEPFPDIRLELSEHDGGRVSYFRFIGKKARATIWTGYFDQAVEEFESDFRARQSDPARPSPSMGEGKRDSVLTPPAAASPTLPAL